MGKSFTVTPEELDSAAKKLQQNAESYTAIYKELMQKVGLMGDAWYGEDNLKYVEKVTGVAQELQIMADKLSTASQTLAKQSQNYKDQQQSNIAQINKLQN